MFVYFCVFIVSGRESEENFLEMWDMIETTFSNLVDSCPPWAQAYLSDELIDDQDAMDQDEKEAEKLIGDAIFSENDVSRS